jgi:hypothetical protein
MLTRRSALIACLIFLVLSNVPVSAQVLLAGNWIPYRTHEDEQDRGPGPDLGDYSAFRSTTPRACSPRVGMPRASRSRSISAACTWRPTSTTAR